MNPPGGKECPPVGDNPAGVRGVGYFCELFQFGQAPRGRVEVTGSDGNVQPVVSGKPSQRGLGHLLEVVQCGRGCPGECCVAALRPPPGVLHQHTEDASRLSGGGPIQFSQQTVIALIAAQRGAKIIRTHDVAETLQALRVANAIEGKQ